MKIYTSKQSYNYKCTVRVRVLQYYIGKLQLMLCAMGKKLKTKKKNINKCKKMVVEKNNIHKNYVFIQRLQYI